MADPRAADGDEPSAQATFRFPFDVPSGGPLRTGPGGTWWATHTPDGPGTLRLAGCGSRAVEATAWGPGRHWLLRQVPPLLGASDRPDRFKPHHEVIRRLWIAGPLRLGRTDRVFDAVVGAVLGTRVQVEMARRSLALLAARHGEPAPGPWPQLRLLPSPARLAALTYPELHRCGVERSRAEVVRRVAAEIPRLEVAAETGSEPLRRRLLSLSGIGPWTTAGVLVETCGDPDAVLLGDYHVPHLVCWALAREPRGSDDRMLELLQPYAGQRARVITLLVRAGWRAPRRGPRLSFQPVDRYDGSAPDPRANRGRGRATGSSF